MAKVVRYGDDTEAFCRCRDKSDYGNGRMVMGIVTYLEFYG